MVRQLLDRNVDFAATQFSNTLTRFPALDVTAYIFVEKLKLFMAKPRSAFAAKMNAFVKDFEWTIWLLGIICGTVLSLMFFVANRLKADNFHQPHDKDEFTLQNAFGIIGITVVQRDYPIKTKKLFARILYLTTIGCAYFIFEVYAASLTSVFTADKYVPTIHDLSDIQKQEYQVNVWTGTAFEQYFKDALPGTVQDKLFKEVIKDTDNQCKTTEHCLLLVLAKEKTLHFGSIYITQGLFHNQLSNVKCNFIELPKVYRKYNSGFAMQKNSELTPLFNYHIGRLREDGQVRTKFGYSLDFDILDLPTRSIVSCKSGCLHLTPTSVNRAGQRASSCQVSSLGLPWWPWAPSLQ